MCNPGKLRPRDLENAGGAWHQLSLPADFPNRYISGLAINPADASGGTVYMASTASRDAGSRLPAQASAISGGERGRRRHMGR